MAEKTNTLTIRLTEAAVFLRSDGTTRQTSPHDSHPSMLRGLVVLELSKPTRITSIGIELSAKASNAWPEGIGARRADITEEHTLFRAETVYFHAGKEQERRNSSIGPGAVAHGLADAGYESDEQHSPPYTPRGPPDATTDAQSALHDTTTHLRNSRRRSADSSYFQRSPLFHEEFPVPPTPPYSPLFQLSYPTEQSPTPSSLEELRSHLNAGIGRSNGSVATSSSRPHYGDHSLSRRPSIENVPENESGWLTPNYSPAPSRPSSRLASRPTSRPPSPPVSHGTGELRGRTGARPRFSLASVSNALIGAVRSASPRTPSESREHPNGDIGKMRRGRAKEKVGYTQSPSTSVVRGRSKEKTALGRIGGILKLDHDNAPAGLGWKEFKKGTYTYPISFSIPANSPPTLHCNYGTVTWRLRATVHRPGTFKSKISAAREVIVITCPTEDDTEDTDNIIVERQWDQQLQYLISISGRSFYIGGTIPITLTLMPLAKVKIHRISVFIEERIDYYTQMKRIARTDPVTYIPLISVRDEGKHPSHILPLDSDDVDVFKKSPLSALLTPDDDPSEMASSLMGPGPWSFHQNLQLPTSCNLIHMTNKNRKSNMVITHQLKCILRVERGDDAHLDPKTGKPKLFDILVQAPIHILSCRCNPEWSSLPRYSESFDNTSTVVPKCPCDVRRDEALRTRLSTRPFTLERTPSGQSSDSSVSAVETSPINSRTMPSLRQLDALYSRSSQYERLISGQESEIGEAPPTYTACLGFSRQSH